jgi:hypothetical protein
LKDALRAPERKFFWISDQGVLYLTVGTLETEEGGGWMDQAVLFCPFCGKKLQTREQIWMQAGVPVSRVQ